MQSAEETTWRVLTPYDPREGISLAMAAKRAGKSETTIRIGALSMVLGVVSEAAFGSSAKLLWQCSWTATCRRLPPTILATIRARSLLRTLNGLACLGQSGPQPTAERTCKDISARTASPLPT